MSAAPVPVKNTPQDVIRIGASRSRRGLLRKSAMRALLALTRGTHMHGRLRLASALNRLLMPPGGYVVSQLPGGLTMELDLTDQFQRRLHYIGEYEKKEIACILSFLPRDGVFLDAGANIGWHTLAAARHLDPGGRVYAFEPIPPNVARIRRNKQLNGFEYVHVEETALSDREETVEMSTPFTRSGNATMAPRERAAQRFQVRCIRLDEYARRHGIERIDFVKIDVEGAEMRVLRGMAGILGRKDAPKILCEVNPTMLATMGASAGDLTAFLAGFGYSGHSLGEGNQLLPVSGIPAEEDHANLVFAR